MSTVIIRLLIIMGAAIALTWAISVVSVLAAGVAARLHRADRCRCGLMDMTDIGRDEDDGRAVVTPAWCHCGLMWLTQGQHEITENDQTHMRAGCPRHNTWRRQE